MRRMKACLCLVGVVLAVGCRSPETTLPSSPSPTPLSPPVPPPTPTGPPPTASLVVTFDTHGSHGAYADVTSVRFDMSHSTGSNLRYRLSFGDGAFASGTPLANHVYGRQPNDRVKAIAF